MKLFIQLVSACFIVVVSGFAQEVAPDAAADGKAAVEQLVVSDIVISRGAGSVDEFDEMPPTASYRVVARITNQSDKPAINPVFHVSLDSSPLDLEGCSSSMILMPNESRVFCSGGLHTSPEILKQAKTAIIKLNGDPFSFAGWNQQLKIVPKLSFKDVTHRKFPKNQMVEVTATFQNDSGFAVAQVMATAVFLDQEGHITDAGPIIFRTQNAEPITKVVGFPMPSVKTTDRCVIQIDRFEDK